MWRIKMKKGFTLIELLIVIIIVALLVTLSVPKYKTSMEKSRAQEGITNINLAADYLNGYYMTHDGSYTGATATHLDKTKSVYFGAVTITANGTTASASVSRSTGLYTLKIELQDGKVSGRSCTGDEDMCDAIGWE